MQTKIWHLISKGKKIVYLLQLLFNQANTLEKETFLISFVLTFLMMAIYIQNKIYIFYIKK